MRAAIQRAFSLLELILALGVFSIGILAVLYVLPHILHTRHDATQYITISTIAESMLAHIRQQQPLAGSSTVIASTDEAFRYLALDTHGRVLAELNNHAYQHGYPGAMYLAGIHCAPYSSTTANLYQLDLNLEWPAAVPQQHRHRQLFYTLWSPYAQNH